MIERPVGEARPRLARRGVACLLSASCAMVLSACGGADDGPAARSAAPPTASSVPQQVPLLGHAMLGQTTVVLNAPATPAPPAAATASPGAEAPDPAAIVGVSRDANGTVRLMQRDGTVREVSLEGKLVVRPDASGTPAGELPPTMIVAVDGANTVHIVDPDACMARTIARDGRVTTTLLPAPGADRPCATARQPAR